MHFDRDNIEENYQKFAAHPLGQRVLAGAPSLFELRTDRESLLQLPAGSVGRIYNGSVVWRESASAGASQAAESFRSRVKNKRRPNGAIAD